MDKIIEIIEDEIEFNDEIYKKNVQENDFYVWEEENGIGDDE